MGEVPVQIPDKTTVKTWVSICQLHGANQFPFLSFPFLCLETLILCLFISGCVLFPKPKPKPSREYCPWNIRMFPFSNTVPLTPRPLCFFFDMFLFVYFERGVVVGDRRCVWSMTPSRYRVVVVVLAVSICCISLSCSAVGSSEIQGPFSSSVAPWKPAARLRVWTSRSVT